VDGAASTDPIVGWGPHGGYVFQKGFVEFFAEEDVVKRIERRVEASQGWVDFFAANAEVSSMITIFFISILSQYRENAEAIFSRMAETP
jgi:hypothetical protein